MDSQIIIFPHPLNQSIISTLTYTASYSPPVSLSVRVLSDSYFSPYPQSIRYFYTNRHHILCRSPESVFLSSSQFLRFSHATPTPLTAAPLSLSVLVGGLVGFVTWSPSRTSDSAVPLYLSVLVGGWLLIPGNPHAPPTMLSLSVLVGRDGFDQAPLAHP